MVAHKFQQILVSVADSPSSMAIFNIFLPKIECNYWGFISPVAIMPTCGVSCFLPGIN